MDSLYSYEEMINQRRRDVDASLRTQRLLAAVDDTDQRTEKMQRTLSDLTQARRILRLGRLVIMW